MAQGIMTGIGFLGAGVIFKEGLNVRGLTTAASIWITAGIGILFGIGFYFPAILSTALTLTILSLFKWIEGKIPSYNYTNSIIAFNRENVPNQEHIKDLLKQFGFRLESMSYQVLEGGLVFEYKMTIRTNDPLNLTRLSKYLIGQLDVKYFQISPFGD
jgi:putative Mg2+ transporter-C (MgtC) family protein